MILEINWKVNKLNRNWQRTDCKAARQLMQGNFKVTEEKQESYWEESSEIHLKSIWKVTEKEKVIRKNQHKRKRKQL